MIRKHICLWFVLFAPTVAANDAHLYQQVHNRLALMKDVAAYKWINGISIENLEREALILEKAATESLRSGIRIEDSKRFFSEQISAAKEIQQYWFSYWENQPGPSTAPDLTTILRPELIKLGNKITRELKFAQPTNADRFFATVKIEGLSKDSKARLYESIASIGFYDNQLDQILDSGILRVGTTGDYEPFSYRAPSENEFRGIDIDLARNLAKTLDVQIRFIQTTWPSLLEDLEQGHFDIAMSGISRHPARRKVGFFSDTYHTGGKTPISRCENKEKFDTLEKINSSDTRIIVNPGGTNEQFIDLWLEQAKKIVHPDNRSIFREIINRNADVMITDSIEVQLQVAKHAELCRTMPARTLTFQEKAYLMPKDIGLKRYVDRWLATRVEDGTVKILFEQHLN